MKLDKLSDEKKLDVCRKYYFAGFVFLPFLWVINFIWFFKQAFRRKPFKEQTEIRKYIIRSAVGAVVWLCLLVTWNIIFQQYRLKWDDIGDRFTFIIPRGKV